HALCNRQSEMQTRIDHRVELTPGRQYAAHVFGNSIETLIAKDQQSERGQADPDGTGPDLVWDTPRLTLPARNGREAPRTVVIVRWLSRHGLTPLLCTRNLRVAGG